MRRSRGTGGGWRPEVGFATDEVAKIQKPTLYIHGSADPEGTVERAKQAVDLLPRGELQTIDGGGHLPWLGATLDPRR